jgi:hypothetical protein
VLRAPVTVLSLNADGALRTLVSGLFTATGIFARVWVDDVSEAVVADLKDIRANILADTASGAKIVIDFGDTHDYPPLDLQARRFKQSWKQSTRVCGTDVVLLLASGRRAP